MPASNAEGKVFSGSWSKIAASQRRLAAATQAGVEGTPSAGRNQIVRVAKMFRIENILIFRNEESPGVKQTREGLALLSITSRARLEMEPPKSTQAWRHLIARFLGRPWLLGIALIEKDLRVKISVARVAR